MKKNQEKKVWLHIGHGKTGTTALQQYFVARAEVDPTFHYPSAGQMPSGAHHRFFPLQHQHKMKEDVPKLLAQLSKDISAKANGVTTVLSSEHMCYFNARQVAQVAKHLEGFDVRVLYYIRRQDELIESTYRWKLEHGRGKIPSLEDVVEEWAKPFDFRQRLMPWRQSFGDERISVRLYHRETVGRDIVSDVCAAIGLSEMDIPHARSEARNSINGHFIDILQAHDMFYPSGIRRNEFINELKKISQYWPESMQKNLFTQDVRLAIMRRFEKCNTVIADDFLDETEKSYLLA